MRGRRLAVVGALALLASLLMPSALLAQGELDQAPGDQIESVGAEAVAPTPGGPAAGAEQSGGPDGPDGRSDDPDEVAEPDGSGEPTEPTEPATVTTGPAGAEQSPREPRATASQATTVRIGDFFFAPETITVEVGDTITWVNDGEVPEGHTATARDGSFDTGVLQPGESGSHTFTRAGTFPYICSIHPGRQRGTVTVRSAADSDPGAPAGEPGAPADSAPGAGPDAAGSPNTADPQDRADRRELPATGLEVLPLLLTGIASMGFGIALGRRARLG